MSARLRFLSLGALGSTRVFAQGVPSAGKFADPAAAAPHASAVTNMGQVTVALVVVLAVLFAAAWLMRRFKLFNSAGQGAITVLQGVSLGPKERAVLISVQGQRLLLGVAPGCVNLLLQLPPDDTATVTAPTDTTAPPSTPDFKTLLKRSMGLS